jgi:outer membrane protein assembly factor BamB
MKWEFQTANAVKSSPTVSNGSVFFGSDDGKIYDVNTNNGSQTWAYDTGSAVESSPAINNTTLYMGTNNGNFYALNTADGSVKWTYNLNDTVKSSAVLDPNDNTLFVGSDTGNFTALDMRDGTLKWSVKTGNVESTAALMGDNIVVTSQSGTVYVLNKFSGKEQWSYMPGYYIFNSPLTSPIVYGDDIFAGDKNGNMYSMDFSRKVGAPSIYLYYLAAIAIIIIGGLLTLRVLRNRRKRKEN